MCGLSHSPPSPNRKFLRSFRSHRNLQSYFDSPTEDMIHQRHPSDASSSSLDTTASSRPSTSSRKTDMSVDWDPLRLHPPLAPGPAPPLREAGDSSRRYEPHELRQARSTHNLRHPVPQSPSTPSCSTVIYDGFDFGFPSSTSTIRATPTTTRHRRRRDPSPTPSDASSIVSNSSLSSADSEPDSPLESEAGLCLGGLAPAPASSCRPRPRPRLHPAGPNSGGLDDDTELFIRRGGWKRRGVVFVNTGAELAPEEESFVY